MVPGLVSRLADRVRSWWTVDDPDERIEGSGEVYLDPAYNGRYTAERELKRLSDAGGENTPDRDPPEPPEP